MVPRPWDGERRVSWYVSLNGTSDIFEDVRLDAADCLSLVNINEAFFANSGHKK